MALYWCIAIQWARDTETSLYCTIQQVFLVYCCRARCIGFALYCCVGGGMTTFDDLPGELQGCCARLLDASSAGRFGLASKACSLLVERQLAAAKAAALAAAPFEKSKHGAMVTYRNPTDGSKLITFSDAGANKLYKCSCSPEKECHIGRSFSGLARHLASRQHWKHWRLVAFGEAQPTEAAWVAFAASLPGEIAPQRKHRFVADRLLA